MKHKIENNFLGKTDHLSFTVDSQGSREESQTQEGLLLQGRCAGSLGAARERACHRDGHAWKSEKLPLSPSSLTSWSCAFSWHICPLNLASASLNAEMIHHIAWHTLATLYTSVYLDTLSVIDPHIKCLLISSRCLVWSLSWTTSLIEHNSYHSVTWQPMVDMWLKS